VQQGQTLHSFTMLSMYVDHHPLMNQFHKHTDEKLIIEILRP
jgi:hypothetical protein